MIRLNIGGTEAKPGWTIFNISPAPHVDVVGTFTDLSRFATESVAEIYASHVLEHVPEPTMRQGLREFNRVMVPGGRLMVAVPDLLVLCRIYGDPRLDVQHRFELMHTIYGGHADEHDVHHAGYDEALLKLLVEAAGFRGVQRVQDFGLFKDMSTMEYLGVRISLNLLAHKPVA